MNHVLREAALFRLKLRSNTTRLDLDHTPKYFSKTCGVISYCALSRIEGIFRPRERSKH